MIEYLGGYLGAQPGNNAERAIIEAAFAGKWAELVRMPADGPLPVVRATFIRQLLSDLSQAPHAWERSGLRIRGAHIEGPLDLTDWTGIQGVALPPLLLDKCEIPEDVDLSYAHIARFSITESRISYIRAEGVRIDGSFDISGVQPFCFSNKPEETNVAWIEAHGARIGGDFVGRNAHLQVPWPRAETEIVAGTLRFALGLGSSTVAGRVLLVQGFRAFGGVSFCNSDVTGEVWLSGAELSSGEGDGFNGQNARFRSGLMLNQGFSARGRVWLAAARMAALHCSDSRFENWTRDGKGQALVANGAEINGGVYLDGKRFKASGAMIFASAKIAGDLDCKNATFENWTKDGASEALNVEGAEIGGRVFLCGEKFRASGNVSFLGAKIGGELDCTGATFKNVSEKGNGIALLLGNAEILGNLLLTRVTCIGITSMWGLHVGRDFESTDTVFASSFLALGASNLRVDGDLDLTRTRVLGHVWLHHAVVGGNLCFRGLHYMKEYHHDGVRIGKVRWADLDLAFTQIGSSLKAMNLTSDAELRINLSDAHIAVLDDRWPAGWGGMSAIQKHHIQLYLDGLVCDSVHFEAERPFWAEYLFSLGASLLAELLRAPTMLLLGLADRVLRDRLDRRECGRNFSSSTPMGLYRRTVVLFAWRTRRFFRTAGNSASYMLQARERLNWLELQREFAPQPYRHLARVLRNQGHPEAAREVGIEESWKAPAQPWFLPIKIAFGYCFGFGLSPLRASITLILVFGVGWAGTSFALRSDAMAITTSPVASLVMRSGQMAVQNGDSALATAEVTCTDEIEPRLYAIDVMVPVVSLHQESSCDVKPKFRALKFAKAAYSGLGKFAVALALITFSGVLKNRAEE